MESIILCGGESKRMKPYLPFSKALAEIKPDTSLIQYQVEWLREIGFRHIILAIDRKTYRTLSEKTPSLLGRVDCSIEEEKLGTGGAVYKAVKQVGSSFFYLMNVDDLILSETYSPLQLVKNLQKNGTMGGTILLSKTQFPFGVVETSKNKVTGFKQKPMLDFNICVGHYAFAKEAVRKYFPRKGNFEDVCLQEMARNRILYYNVLQGIWITINNVKQLEAARRHLRKK